MNCNYDCDESPSLSSNDCLMKDVTVLICSGVDGLSIFVSFSSWFNSRKFEYIFWKYWYKMFRLLVFLLHSKKKWNSSSKTIMMNWIEDKQQYHSIIGGFFSGQIYIILTFYISVTSLMSRYLSNMTVVWWQ